MPKYLVELEDGRKFQVEADGQPSEQEVLDFIGQQPSQSGVQLLNNTESLQTPSVAPTAGYRSLMQPPQFAALEQQPVVTQPPAVAFNDPAVRLQQYQALNTMREQIEAEKAQADASVHEYPFLSFLQEKVGTKDLKWKDGKIESTFSPLFPKDPQQQEIVAESEAVRQQKLADLEKISKLFGFDKVPGTELPDVMKPGMQFGIRANTVKQALGTGETTSKVVAGLQQAVAGVPEMLTSPFGLATAPLMAESIVGKQTAKQAGRLFVGDMVTHLPEQAAAAKQAFEQGDVEGATRALAGIALTTALAGKEIKGAAPGIRDSFKGANAKWEVVPNEPIGPSRQLPEAQPIDIQAEVQTQPQIPQARRFYQSESKNPPVDAQQLTPRELDTRLAVARQYEAPQPKRTYQGEVEIIGRNEPANIAKELGVRYDGQQQLHPALPVKDVYTSLDKKNPFTVYVDAGAKISDVASRLAEKRQQDVGQQQADQLVKPELPSKPVEQPTGGQVSFASAAGVGSIPNARQAAIAAGSNEPALPPSLPAKQSLSPGNEKIAEAESKSPISDTSVTENLSGQQPKPAESRSINEQDIENLNTGPLTKSQQEWIMSSAKKLLRSPEQLRYAPDRKGEFDAGQLVNRLMNNIPPVEKEMLTQAGIQDAFKPGQKVTKEAVEKWIDENGPKVEVQTYGMEGKVSEAKREYDRMTHEWFDSLQPAQKRDYYDFNAVWENDLSVLGNWSQKDIDKAVRYKELSKQTSNEPRDTSPRATSAYESVSAFDTRQSMPEWTKSKEGRNVQRVDVVLPNKKYVYTIKGINARGEEEIGTVNREQILWQPDNLHENLPNTLGWAMLQYKTGPKGEKIAVVVEAQSRWGQEIREIEKRKKLNESRNMPEAAKVNARQIEEKNHPLLKDYNRLILKAAIEQARKEGAEYVAISDAETAMMTEGHDSMLRNDDHGAVEKEDAQSYIEQLKNNPGGNIREYYTEPYSGSNYKDGVRVKSRPTRPEQEPGMRLNYDTILPKIAEELTGSKGERVSLGEHKNATVEDSPTQYDGQGLPYHYDTTLNRNVPGRAPRSNLIFRNPDGTPKTDVSALLFPLNKVSAAQERSPFTLTGSDKLKEKKDAQGQTIYYHSGIPLSKEAKDILKRIIELPVEGIRLYAEPMAERLARVGGPVSKKVAEEVQRMSSRQKEFYGQLTPTLDPAKRAVGKLTGPGNLWLRKRNSITENAAVNNLFAQNEGTIAVPVGARPTIDKVNVANAEIGKLATKANPDFIPTGKLQRVLTNFGYDIIRRGQGDAWNAWTEGVAKANNKPVSDVQDFYKKWKEELDAPSSDVATMNRINQDFVRRFPKTVTHVKSLGAWHEVIVADPFNYLESAAQRTSHAAAFREVYPLVRDPTTGKLSPSNYLASTRKAVMKELDTAGVDATNFDNLISAVQGHPLDRMSSAFSAPDTVTGAGYRMVRDVVLNPIKALMLTANAPTNFGELFIGGPTIFLGSQNTLAAMKRLAADNSLAAQLEMTGARNQAMYNMSFDPNSPVRSASRIGSNILRKVTFQQFLNELQETTAAMSAKQITDRISGVGRPLTKYEQNRMQAVLQAMGFTEKQAKAALAGDKDILRQFENKASAWLTAGNQSVVEKSRVGASRAFNELFWFHSYPQMTLNQVRAVGGRLYEEAGSYAKKPTKEGWSKVYHNASLFARVIAGRALQGAVTLGVLALVSNWLFGLKQKKQEAMDEPLDFAKDAWLAGMGGPIAVLHKLSQGSKDSKELTAELVNLSPSVTAIQELVNAGAGLGRYEEREATERINMFLESKAPGYRALKTGLAVAGLSEKDVELDTAIKAFYAWRREQPGYKPASAGGVNEKDLEFRVQMRRVKEAFRNGEDWRKELAKVKDLKQASQSLRAGTLLEVNGKPLTNEQEKQLEGRLGKPLVEKLKTYDAMIREIAREVGELSKTEGTVVDIPEPTGRFATDATTATQRSESVKAKVEPSIVKLLESNKLDFPSYEAEIKEWGQKEKRQLTKEEAAMYEPLLVEEYNRRLAPYLNNDGFSARPLLWRQEKLQERMAKAREVAQVRLRAKLRQAQ